MRVSDVVVVVVAQSSVGTAADFKAKELSVMKVVSDRGRHGRPLVLLGLTRKPLTVDELKQERHKACQRRARK